MKKQLTLAFLVNWLMAFPQPLPEMAYVRRVDSAINGRYATSLELKQTSDCADQLTAWYIDDRLIGVHTTLRSGANESTETSYYVRNDTLVYTTQQVCRTVPPEGNPEERTDNLNDDKRPESRTNCLSVALFLQSRRMLHAIDGEDVFGDQPKLEQEEAEMLICYSRILNDLRKER